MMNSLYAAATGMAAQQTQLDVIANNLANVNTTGFKSSRVGFEDLFYQQVNSRQAARPGAQVGMGSAVTSTSKSFAQGTLSNTDDPMNVGIEGRGFIQVSSGAELLYTRAGDLKIDANGQFVLPGGQRLAPPIQLPQGADTSRVSISPAGVVTVKMGGTPQTIGVITLADFINPAGLEAVGSSMYRASVASGPPVTAQPGTNGVGTLVQGTLEGSNVSVMREMIDMISAQRAFESVSRVISTTDEMLGMANGMRR